jgi:2-polyprenyl-3-methyl-5-hydroxy-6-metoxy-1,4-benzoquinol methylase
MKFYESISEYYDKIIPLKRQAVNFVNSNLQHYDKCKVIDIGCATGHMDAAIASNNVKVEGIDLDKEMIAYANDKYNSENVSFHVMNMLSIDEEFQLDSFDIVTCFGNTLVHLVNEEEVYTALDKMKKVLKKHGKLLIQILNYQYILDECIKELPLIENEHIKFERFYSEQVRDERLIFETRLTIKKTGEIISNEIYLYPLLKDQLEKSLKKLGFSNIHFYSNFNKEPYTYNHLPLVVEAVLD